MKSLLFLCFILLSTLSASAQSIPIWHSRMDSDPATIIGQAAHPVGFPLGTEDMYGNPGGAVLFNGSNEYYRITAPAETIILIR